MADEGNLDTITLKARDLAIDEVRVGQSNQILSASGATYYPSLAAKRQAFSGFDVLSKLGMEQLVFNRQDESVSTLTGGTVQILLNGEPVTTKELTKLPPKQIQRVEFSDVPSALYPDAAGVLNVVVKHPETGGDFHRETTQPLMVKRNWVRGGVTLYFPHQMLQINGLSQYSNYPGQIEFGESEYRFPTGTVTRKVNPIPARYQAWDRHAELWYRWYNERSLLSLYANIGPFDRYHDDWAGEVIHTHPRVPADTLRYHHSHNLKSFLPDFGGYFHTKVGEAGETG